jgi:hypothetical protein
MTGPIGVILTEGETSTIQITGTGGVQPYTFTLAPTSKLLPGGLALQANGQIVGSSNTPGLFPFTVVLTDHTGATLTSTTFSIAISGGAFVFSPTTLPDAVVGVPYAQSISVSGSVPPYTFALVGTLPGNLVGAADPSGLSYKISGTPATAGNSAVSIKVTDAIGNQTILPLTNFQVVPQLTVGKVNPQIATVSTPFTFQVPITGGLPPYTVTTSPALPTGLTITSTGLIAGTPTAAPGIYPVTISVTDTLGLSGATTLNLELSSGTLEIAPGSIFVAEPAGVAFTLPLPVVGGVPPYTYALASNPNQALAISSSGVLSGTISLAGSEVVAFSVTDSTGTTVPLAITIPVQPSLTASGIGNSAS